MTERTTKIAILGKVFEEFREKLVELQSLSYPYLKKTDEAIDARIEFLDTLEYVLNNENTDSYDETLLMFAEYGDVELNDFYEMVRTLVAEFSIDVYMKTKNLMDGRWQMADYERGIFDPVKFHGNNPVKDSWGLYDFSADTNTITCDLNDPKSMKSASAFFTKLSISYLFDNPSVIAIDLKTGKSITFNNARAMSQLLEEDIDWEGLLAEISTIVGAATVGSNINNLIPDLTKGLAKFGTTLSTAATLVDVVQAFLNPNADTISDAIINGIGLWGIKGTAISIGLAYTKKPMIGLAKKAALLNDYLYKEAVKRRIYNLQNKW